MPLSTFKQLSTTKSFIFICLVLFAFGCQKDESDSSSGGSGGSGGGVGSVNLPSGDMDASINGSNFQSGEARARYRSTDEFTIKALANNGDEILIVIDEFAGEANYTFSGNSSFGRVLRIVDGDVQHFSTAFGGSGSLTISSYSSATNEISGSFSFSAGMSGSSASVTVESGSFSDVPIIELVITDIPQGEVGYFTYDVFSSSTDIQALTTGHYKFNMEIENENLPTLRLRNGFNFLNFSNYSTEEPHVVQINFGGAFFDESNCELLLEEYDESNNTISGRVEVSTSDIEVIFNRIPVEFPETSPEGTITFHNGEENIVFDQDAMIYYDFEPNETNYREIEATNADGNRIFIRATYPWYDVGDPAAWENHTWGYDAFLEYYEDGNSSSPTETIYGNFEMRSTEADGSSNIGFESDDLTQRAIGLEIEHE